MDPPLPSPPLLKGGWCKFPLPSPRGGGGWNLKNLKRGWKYGAEVGLLNKEGGRGGTFPIQFLQGLSHLHLEITLLFAKLCYGFEEKLFFSAIIIL